MSERHTQTLLHSLVAKGFLTVMEGNGRQHPNHYSYVGLKGEVLTRKGELATAPEPSLEPIARTPKLPRQGRTQPIWGRMVATGEEGLFLPLRSPHPQPRGEPSVP